MRFLVMGAGGFAKELADMIELLGHSVVACYQDPDSTPAKGHAVERLPVIGDISEVDFDVVALGVGRAAVRERFMQLVPGDDRWPVLIHPTASISPYCNLGAGAIAMQNVVVSADAEVARGTLLNVGTYVAHDAAVGAFSHLAPGTTLGGGSTIGVSCELGLGTVVLPNVHVASGCKTGAGAVVVEDVEPGNTVAGVPARALR